MKSIADASPQIVLLSSFVNKSAMVVIAMAVQADVPFGNEYCDIANVVSLIDEVEDEGGEDVGGVGGTIVAVASSTSKAPESRSSRAVSMSSFVIASAFVTWASLNPIAFSMVSSMLPLSLRFPPPSWFFSFG